tara:strand:+ start:3007 stop:3768 length:762 start_codon:yes stop_codon:yes gene_type:complete
MVLLTGFCFQIKTCNTAIFIGLSTFVAYNGIRYLKYKKGLLREVVFIWFEKNKGPLSLMNFSAIVYLLVTFRQFDINSLLVMLPFSLLTLLYMNPLGASNKKSLSLRKIPGFKIFCISISWSGLVVLFPLVEANIEIGVREFMFFLQQVLFVLVLTLPFDLRDIPFDEKELKTIPQVLGVRKTKILGIGFILIFCVISCFLFQDFLLYNMIFIGILQIFLLLTSAIKQSEYFASFWVEAIPLFWVLIVSFTCF